MSKKSKALDLSVDYTGATVKVKHAGSGVVRLILSRPDVRNAFNAEMISELNSVLAELAATRDADRMRVLVLEGEGSTFCAGADLAYMQEQARGNEAMSLSDARVLGTLFFRLASFPTTVIAAVRGAAIGGGFGLVCCSDVVVAEAKSVFATSEVRLGIVPGVISPYIVRKVGTGRAAAPMLSGMRLNAHQASEIGLVNHIVDAGNDEASFHAALVKVINEHLAAGPNAVRRTKELLRKISPLPDPGLFEYTAQAIAMARCSEEGQHGLGKFFEKSQPQWLSTIDASEFGASR